MTDNLFPAAQKVQLNGSSKQFDYMCEIIICESPDDFKINLTVSKMKHGNDVENPRTYTDVEVDKLIQVISNPMPNFSNEKVRHVTKLIKNLQKKYNKFI